MFDRAPGASGSGEPKLFPNDISAEQEALSAFIYAKVNNGLSSRLRHPATR
ncbi:MAG: hypothetical protein ABIR38_00420 [Chthoniobacterales bacterium]